MSRLSKYDWREPNRALLRKLGFSKELRQTSEPVTSDAVRAACADEHHVGSINWLAREEAICASNAAAYIYEKKVSDRIARISRHHPSMTVGLTTALWLGGILSVRPAIDHWMFAEAKRRPIWLPPNVRVHRSRHAEEGARPTLFAGWEVPVHVPLRATLDCVRFRDELGDAVVAEALSAVLASGSIDRDALLYEAKRNKVLKPLIELLSPLH